MHFIGAPRRPEIDQYTIKFLIGAIAFSLPWIELWLTRGSIESISASFWYDVGGPWPRDIFVGFLFAIAAFMLAYNGKTETEMWLTKVASAAALGVALFPCGCGDASHEILPHVHLICAGALFAVLAWFCYTFYKRAREKKRAQANWRAWIYTVSGLGMLAAMALFVTYAVTKRETLVFWGEAIGLVAFGTSWLTASHVVPGLNGEDERHSLVRST